MSDVPELFTNPIKQEVWYKQIRNSIGRSKRPIDKMSVAEIRKLYQEKKILCDSCGKEMVGKGNYTLEDHIVHLINPNVLWSCEDCFQVDLRKGRIIAMEEEPTPEVWQDHNK
ncbi:MAG: hypothetical protein ACRDFB_10450 [Rhabdochlamydiaceae bacterium]